MDYFDGPAELLISREFEVSSWLGGGAGSSSLSSGLTPGVAQPHTSPQCPTVLLISVNLRLVQGTRHSLVKYNRPF